MARLRSFAPVPAAFRSALEVVFQGYADREHFDVLGLDPTRYGFAQVSAQMGRVTAQRIPDDATSAEGIEVDPAALDPERERFSERIVHAEQDLVAEQRVGKLGLHAAGRSRPDSGGWRPRWATRRPW